MKTNCQNSHLSISFLLLGIGVGLGAFGADGLKSLVSTELLANWHTATLYLFIHSISMALISLSPVKSIFTDWAIRMYIGGIIIFCGDLYLYVLSGSKIFALIVPIGGTMFIIGHVLAFIGIRKNLSLNVTK